MSWVGCGWMAKVAPVWLESQYDRQATVGKGVSDSPLVRRGCGCLEPETGWLC